VLVHTQVILEALVHPPGADEVAPPRHPATQGGIAVLVGGGAVLVVDDRPWLKLELELLEVTFKLAQFDFSRAVAVA